MVKKIMLIVLSGFFAVAAARQSTAAPATLSQIIEGAKKEGAVSCMLKSGLTPASMTRLEKEIREKYRLDLKISYTPTGSMPKALSLALMEHKMGAVPSQDLVTFGPEHIVTGLEAGIFEKVDWRSILPKEVSRDVIVTISPFGDVGVSCYTSQQGLMYNTQKVSAKDVPKTMKDLADPKWKGKVGIFNYTASWALRAHILGKEFVYGGLRSILKNGAIQGRYEDISNRFLLGEIWIAGVGNSYFSEAKEKGMPAAWQNLDYVDEESRPLAVLKGAQHPNAAKLVAIYLVSPEGARFILEESGGGNMAYPGNYTYDIRSQGKEQGMRVVSKDSLIGFIKSDEFEKWNKEIDLIFKTTGER